MKWSCLLLCCFTTLWLPAQNTDSLWAEFKNESLDSLTRVRSLHRMVRHFVNNDPDSALTLANLEVAFAESMADSSYIAHGLNMQGWALMSKNDFTGAIDKFYRLLDIRLTLDDTIGLATAYNNIGNIYFYQNDYPKALDFYIKSLHYEQMKPNDIGLATSMINIGSVYANQEEYKSALEYFNRALQLYQKADDKNGIASCYANMGNIYKNLNRLDTAKQFLVNSIELMEETNDDYGLATSYSNLADVHRLQGNSSRSLEFYTKSEALRVKLDDQLGLANVWIARGMTYALSNQYEKAIQECQKGLKIAESQNSLSSMRDACDCLYLANKGLGNGDLALEYFEQYNKLQDSLAKDETLMKLQVMEFRSQVARDSIKREEEKWALATSHEKQITRGQRFRNLLIGIGGLLILVSIFLFRLFRKTRESKEAIEVEKHKADELLLNILPAEIAEELLKSGKVEAQEFDNVTMLFTDIVGFTQASEKMPAQALLDELNLIYSEFDRIVATHGVEKIKSIGDAYMAAGGLPLSTEKTVKNTILAGLEMQEFMIKRQVERKALGLPVFEMRVGIHTGPVVAGIIGVKKFQYDVWGDTVNTANRIETNGASSRVNISESTYELVKSDPDFEFEQRGKIPVKGKGEMQMYFVKRKMK